MAKHRKPTTHTDLARRLGTWTLIAAAGAASAVTISNAGTSAWENTTHVTPAAPSTGVVLGVDELDPNWKCWAQGNRECSVVPLAGPGDGVGVQVGLSVAPSVQPVTAVCSTDADCAAWDLARGVVSYGRP